MDGRSAHIHGAAHPFFIPQTFKSRGLAVDDRGWIKVNRNLQSTSHPHVFAAGDCCTVLDPHFKPPPKAGVYAVRAGPILIQNLVAHLNGEALVDYIPQTDFLKLLMCGDGTAIGFRFGIGEHIVWNKEAERSALNERFGTLLASEARAMSGSNRAALRAIGAVQNDRLKSRAAALFANY